MHLMQPLYMFQISIIILSIYYVWCTEKNKSIFPPTIGKVSVTFLWFPKEGKSEKKEKEQKTCNRTKHLKFLRMHFQCQKFNL